MRSSLPVGATTPSCLGATLQHCYFSILATTEYGTTRREAGSYGDQSGRDTPFAKAFASGFDGYIITLLLVGPDAGSPWYLWWCFNCLYLRCWCFNVSQLTLSLLLAWLLMMGIDLHQLEPPNETPSEPKHNERWCNKSQSDLDTISIHPFPIDPLLIRLKHKRQEQRKQLR
jgi:hypothetical protein